MSFFHLPQGRNFINNLGYIWSTFSHPQIVSIILFLPGSEGYHYLAPAGLELAPLLPHPLRCWNDRHVSPSSAHPLRQWLSDNLLWFSV